ncbi:hypothetical protein DFH09DRAFT_1213984 [Mycena vulgaris]|nr:hypothetical protein DFH09DRAFT_1213984 [Mycena vulgaris]
MPHLSLARALMRALKAASLAAAARGLRPRPCSFHTLAHRAGAGWGLRRCTGKRRHGEMAVSRGGAELQGGIMVWGIGCRWMWDTRRRVRPHHPAPLQVCRRVPWCHERVRQVLRDPQQRVAVREQLGVNTKRFHVGSLSYISGGGGSGRRYAYPLSCSSPGKGRSEREREAAVTSPSAMFGSCPRSSWTSVAACCRYFVGRFFE